MNQLMVPDLDTILRLIATGAALMLFLVLVSGTARPAIKLTLGGILIGGIAYLINSSWTMVIEKPFNHLVDLTSMFTVFWTWWFSRILFDRETDWRWLAILPAFFVICWYLSHFVPSVRGISFLTFHFGSLLLIVDVIYTALSGRDDDLIEKRRLIRVGLPILVGLQAAGILTYEIFFGIGTYAPLVQIVNAALILLLILLAGFALLQTDNELLSAPAKLPTDTKPALSLSPSETVLHEKLMTAMGEGQYRATGLTIQSLAAELCTPEHRLRALINRKLGHRNFSSFLNGHRIGEAKQKLADRGLVDLPILTIAMDLGYNSLAPFNRAFRAETGLTPSDFRKKAIDQN